MKEEMEITVKVTTDYETLKNVLEKQGFSIKEEYELNDIYMIEKNIPLRELSKLEVLKKCILVRDIVGIKKVLLYKYKEYLENGDIKRQGKIECPILDIQKAVLFMEAIFYKTLFKIYDKCIVFANDETELVVQLVNNKYIFIELENTCQYVKKTYNSILDMKEDLQRYNLPIDETNFFVKKAEIMLEEVLKKEGSIK